jgi:hypothetical protein
MRNQCTGLSGCRCGAGKNTKVISAIQPNSPISNAVSDATSALAASIRPLRSERPRIGAIAKYWNTTPSATAAR